MVESPVRWGVLSTAKINNAFLGGASAARGAEIVAVASRDHARASAYAAQRGIPRWFGSYEELLADPEIEAVYIPLPNSLHVPWTLNALQAGKHVLCEKPLTRHRAEAERVVARAQALGLHVSEAFMYRHNPQIRRLGELVGDGAIGALRAIRSNFSFNLDDPGNVRLVAALDGGALMDVGCYCVSASRFLGGEPVRVSGMATMAGGVDMRFAGVLEMPDGVLAHFDCGFDVVFGYELQAVGDTGVITLHDPGHGRTPGLALRTEAGTEHIEIDVADSYRLEAENFSAAVRGQAPLLIDGEEIVAQAAVIEALYAAASSGAAVALA